MNGFEAVVFWLGVAGLFFDWYYIKHGGVPPTRDEKRYLAYGVAFCATAVVVLRMLGGSPEALGSLSGLLISLIVFLWSARRYAIRRRARRQGAELRRKYSATLTANPRG